MSDYNCWIRTNYFRVKDENALEELLSTCRTNGHLQLRESEEGKNIVLLVMDEFTAYRTEKLRTKRKRIMERSLPDCRSFFRLARR